MKDKEINNFIRETGKMGDIWTKEQVKDVYQNVSLEEALADRQRSYDKMRSVESFHLMKYRRRLPQVGKKESKR